MELPFGHFIDHIEGIGSKFGMSLVVPYSHKKNYNRWGMIKMDSTNGCLYVTIMDHGNL